MHGTDHMGPCSRPAPAPAPSFQSLSMVWWPWASICGTVTGPLNWSAQTLIDGGWLLIDRQLATNGQMDRLVAWATWCPRGGWIHILWPKQRAFATFNRLSCVLHSSFAVFTAPVGRGGGGCYNMLRRFVSWYLRVHALVQVCTGVRVCAAGGHTIPAKHLLLHRCTRTHTAT